MCPPSMQKWKLTRHRNNLPKPVPLQLASQFFFFCRRFSGFSHTAPASPVCSLSVLTFEFPHTYPWSRCSVLYGKIARHFRARHKMRLLFLFSPVKHEDEKKSSRTRAPTLIMRWYLRRQNRQPNGKKAPICPQELIEYGWCQQKRLR